MAQSNDGLLFNAFAQELAFIRQQRPKADNWEEPDFYWIADPPGVQLVRQYLQQLPPSPEGILPVFCAAIPPKPPRQRNLTYLSRALLRQFGDPHWQSWNEPSYRLETLLQQAQTELIIFTEFHNLISRGEPLRRTIEWLVSFCKAGVRRAQVLAVGERARTTQVTLVNGWVARRFHYLRLPGDLPEADNPEARAQLQKLLGLPQLDFSAAAPPVPQENNAPDC